MRYTEWICALALSVLGGCDDGASGDPVADAADRGAPDAQLDATVGDATPPDQDPPAAEATLIAAARDLPVALAVDARSVYWVEQQQVMRAPLAGGEAEVLFTQDGADTIASPQSIASIQVQGDWLHWADFHDADGSIERFDLAAEAHQTIVDEGPARAPMAIAVVGEHLYWTRMVSGGLVRLPLDAMDAVPEVVIEGTFSTGIAVDGARVYIGDTAGKVHVWDAEAGRGAEIFDDETLIPGGASVPALAAESGQVFFIFIPRNQSALGGLIRMAADGSDPTILFEGRTRPRAIVADATHVFWTEGGDYGNAVPAPTGRLMRARHDGSEATVLAEGWAVGLAQDAEYVYWTRPLDGEIWRIRKR